MLIDGFDAMAAGCADDGYSRRHTILYQSPEWAQKQAQLLWDRAAQAGRLAMVKATLSLPAGDAQEEAYRMAYDLIYCWIPFALYANRGHCERIVEAVKRALAPGGLAFLVGPRDLSFSLLSSTLRVVDVHGTRDLARLPLLTEHLRLRPRTHLNPALTVFLVEKRWRAVSTLGP